MAHAKPSAVLGLILALAVAWSGAMAQSTGTLTGRVLDEKSRTPLQFVNVVIKGTTQGAATDEEGNYEIRGVAPGTYSLIVRLVGHQTRQIDDVTVSAGETVKRDITLIDASVQVGDITVYGASKRTERLTEAPAAVSVLQPADIKLGAASGQLPQLLQSTPGVDLVQSGVQDFNVNTRGFNSSLNRRLLVLQDGRDLAIAFLGNQEWNGLALPVEDFYNIELVRGPGSALYGPNAFNGVLNMTTPAPYQVLGGKATLAGGSLSHLRGDVRYAGLLGDQWSYKANLGRVQSETWSKSRTITDTTEAGQFEYPGLRTSPDGRSLVEARRLDAAHVASTYGSLRFDYQTAIGSTLTLEGGISRVENEVFLTGIGRVQVTKADKPWGRVNFNNERLNVMVWGQGRMSLDPQYSLTSGLPLEEKSQIFHGEFQYNDYLLGESLRYVVGASHRFYNVDTDGTLMAEEKRENTSGLFGQVEYQPDPLVKFVAATRVDWSTLHETMVSPKAGVVITPEPSHSFRATFNRAFQVPNFSEFFLQVPVGTADLPFFVSGTNPRGTTQVLARGNDDLLVETITGYEVGYKGVFFDNTVFITADAYLNQAEDFITDLLQGVNPDYPFNVPPGFPAGLVEVARQQVPGLTIVDGKPAVVVSYTNAGKVDLRGVELGIAFYPFDALRLTGSWTWNEFDVKEQNAKDQLLPNSPKNKFGWSVRYSPAEYGFEVELSGRHSQGYRWAAGIFVGDIPAYTLWSIGAGYSITSQLRVGLGVTNLTNESVYTIFGGSVNGRQGILTLTTTF